MNPRTKAIEQCSACGLARADVRQLVVGPGLFLCDRCIGQASAELLGRRSQARREATRCSFCEKTADVPVWVRPPVTVCLGCVDLLNETLYDAVGADVLSAEACRRVEKNKRAAEKAEQRLEMALMGRRSTSLRQEIVGVNLSLIVQNVKDLLKLVEGAEGWEMLRAVSLPRRREAIHVFERLRAALEARPGQGASGARGRRRVSGS